MQLTHIKWYLIIEHGSVFNTRYIIYLQIPEMIDYARCDTHYLMDIYHCMKDELLDRGNDQKNLLHAVYTQSNSLCKFWRIPETLY